MVMEAIRIVSTFILGFVTPFAILGVFTFMEMFEDYWSKK